MIEMEKREKNSPLKSLDLPDLKPQAWDSAKGEWKPEVWNSFKKEWNPWWGQESSWNPHRDKFRLEATAYAPKVKIKNDLFPGQHEIYNCTTCRLGEPEHPANKLKNAHAYRIKCRGNKQWNEGPRFEDIGCISWDRKRQGRKE